jgi:hypothetical protein
MLNLTDGFDQGFDQYPSQPTLPAIEFEFAERNLQRMISIMEEVANDHSAKLFGSAAIELRRSDPEVAGSLLELASKDVTFTDKARSLQQYSNCFISDSEPREAEDAVAEDARIISQYIANINQLAQVANDDNVNLFIKAAEALEGTNLQAAKKFMTLAQSIRPYGPYIKRKLAQYEREGKSATAAPRKTKFSVRAEILIRRCWEEILFVLKSEQPWSELRLLGRRIKAKIFY